MVVSLTPRVLLLTGIEPVAVPAGYSTDVLNVTLIITSRSMKSSDDVTLHQVQDTIVLFT